MPRSFLIKKASSKDTFSANGSNASSKKKPQVNGSVATSKESDSREKRCVGNTANNEVPALVPGISTSIKEVGDSKLATLRYREVCTAVVKQSEDVNHVTYAGECASSSNGAGTTTNLVQDSTPGEILPRKTRGKIRSSDKSGTRELWSKGKKKWKKTSPNKSRGNELLNNDKTRIIQEEANTSKTISKHGEEPETSSHPFTCSLCGKCYATSSNLSRHKQTHRSLDSKQAKACVHCGKRYVSMPALSMHVLTHERSHECNVCGKRFSRPWLLQGHSRSHTGERPFQCPQCDKSFADRSNFRAHEQTHSLLKQYQCERCHRSFALKSYLTKHEEATCFAEDKS